MIRLEAALDGEGILVGYQAEGHAGAGPKGADIVCAAVSALSRALVGALQGREGVRVNADAQERGKLRVKLSYSGDARVFLEGAGAVLLAGLASVAEDYPEFCNLTITRK
ncbi:MAG: ribosomal-processing cysteine protease Prp [Spirochaetaceae bacterium]|jgi:uncharacterized protein YsxB (DUF464 family)|nr:ribosomal-processing cysteine protease Prp [Spirochaetaceae bacterium]